MLRTLFPLLLALALASPSAALTLDFYESLDHGAVAVDGSMDFGSYSVTVSNPNRAFDLGVAFDSGASGTADSDLEFGTGWAGGNLADEALGNLLILQENVTGCDTGTCSSPDDEARRPLAGSWLFELDDRFSTFYIDLVDIGDDDNQGGRISFLDGSGMIASFEFLALEALFADQDLDFGNRKANRVGFSSEAIGGAFNRIEIELFGSGALANIRAEDIAQVPEPGTMGLVGLGLIGLALRTRRRFA